MLKLVQIVWSSFQRNRYIGKNDLLSVCECICTEERFVIVKIGDLLDSCVSMYTYLVMAHRIGT